MRVLYSAAIGVALSLLSNQVAAIGGTLSQGVSSSDGITTITETYSLHDPEPTNSVSDTLRSLGVTYPRYFYVGDPCQCGACWRLNTQVVCETTMDCEDGGNVRSMFSDALQRLVFYIPQSQCVASAPNPAASQRTPPSSTGATATQQGVPLNPGSGQGGATTQTLGGGGTSTGLSGARRLLGGIGNSGSGSGTGITFSAGTGARSPITVSAVAFPTKPTVCDCDCSAEADVSSKVQSADALRTLAAARVRANGPSAVYCAVPPTCPSPTAFRVTSHLWAMEKDSCVVVL